MLSIMRRTAFTTMSYISINLISKMQQSLLTRLHRMIQLFLLGAMMVSLLRKRERTSIFSKIWPTCTMTTKARERYKLGHIRTPTPLSNSEQDYTQIFQLFKLIITVFRMSFVHFWLILIFFIQVVFNLSFPQRNNKSCPFPFRENLFIFCYWFFHFNIRG